MFQVFNDLGVLTVDSSERQIRFVGKFVITLTGGKTVISTGVLTKCWVAFGYTNGAFVSVAHDPSSGQVTLIHAANFAGRSVTVLLFAETAAYAEAVNYGLNVFLADGSLGFSTNQIPLVVMGNVLIGEQLNASVSIPAKAFILSPPDIGRYIAGQVQTEGFGRFLVGVDVWSVGNGSLSRGQKIVAQIPDPNIYASVTPQRPNIPMLLVDGSRY